jgi:cysteine desulfurase
MELEPIYFDNNATTRPCNSAIEAINSALNRTWANPSGLYPFSTQAKDVIDRARTAVARLAGATSSEIVFTSGGTESIHTAIRGVTATKPGKHLVTTAVEHAATLSAISHLQSSGYAVSHVPVDDQGELCLGDVEAAIRPDTALVSMMLANNETGVLFPIEQVAAICRKKGVLLHVDAVQALGKMRLFASKWSDLMSFSGHKIHGPKGIGALYIRRHLKFQPLFGGGHQEHDTRAGTENVPGIVGFGAAAEEADVRLQQMQENRVKRLRDFLEFTVLSTITCVKVNGQKAPRLPNTSSLTISGIDSKRLVHRLGKDGICISNGSACATGSPKPSHVLQAMGASSAEAFATVRISLGYETTEQQIAKFNAALRRAVQELRA